MVKLVTLYIDGKEGDFSQGFPVSLKIRDAKHTLGNKVYASLPANPELLESYELWQSLYISLVSSLHSSRRVTSRKVTNVSITEIIKARDKLKSCMNDWLDSEEFMPVIHRLDEKLKLTDNILLIINTNLDKLQKLPWHFWHFFDDYTRSEVALSLTVRQRKLVTPKDRVKILAVFGNNQTSGDKTRINIDKDWELLQQHLLGAEFITPLREPTLEELHDYLWEQTPEIFYYGGHSSIEVDGRTTTINLRHNENIEINDLIKALKKAGDKGLQLAIFNSCEGLGIARQLADSSIPQVIVMRELVPDEVARKFLQYFLEEFANQMPLHLAVRQARERMSHLEKKFPGATLLPMIFQNPVELPYTWRKIQGISTDKELIQINQGTIEFFTGSQSPITLSENNNNTNLLLREEDVKPSQPSTQKLSGMNWQDGQLIYNGKYKIEKYLGGGGFAVTYQAMHTKLNRRVVIKTPNINVQRDPDYPKYVERFKKEAQMLAMCCADSHPHIVQVFDFFEEEGRYCLEMQYIAGESLWDYVRNHGALPETEAVKYIRQIGLALVDVHHKGIFHLDVTPPNIMLNFDQKVPNSGKAVLIDFGIAGDISPPSTLSRSFGNKAFAPYELTHKGSRHSTVDVYCIAASLYYAVTRQRPTNSFDRKYEQEELIPPQQHVPSLSNVVNQAILRGMALEAKDRPQTMQKWLDLLN